jgi:hypothetical protein
MAHQSPFPPSASPSSDDTISRPNRWRGPGSSWQTLTEPDRQTWRALENVRRADLGVHLYNAFALRRGFRRGPDVVDVDGDDSRVCRLFLPM